MRRICCFCEAWESGGIESFLNNILSRMDLSGAEVDIVAARMGESVFRPGLEGAGVRFVELSGVLRSPENGKRFRQLLRQRQYDVVHFNLFQGLSLHYGKIAAEEGVPVRIVHAHGAGLRRSAARQLKLLLHGAGRRLWAGSATDFWACSRQAGEFLFPPSVTEGEALRIIPNGIETARFRFSAEGRRAVRARLGLAEDALLLGTVGRLSREKNQAFLLDVFAAVSRREPDSRLLLVGAGEEEAALRRLAAERNIADRVVFYGVTDRVEEVLWAMDVFLFPSLFEGLGIACVEAQAAGLPVLCSEHIPPEAKLTPLVHTVPLDKGPEGWAEEMTLCLREHCLREDGAAWVRAAGFDVSDAVRMAAARYMEERNEESIDIGDRTGIQSGKIPAQMP